VAPGPRYLGHELAERALQPLLVDLVGPQHDLEQRVARGERVAAVERQQQPLQRRPQRGVQPADRAEVQQPQAPVGQQQDVARVGVGVEDPVEHDLAQQDVQQGPGQRVAVEAALGERRPGGGQGRAVQPLHDQHPLGAARLVRPGDHHAPVGGGGRHRRQVARLDAEVQLLADRAGEAGGQLTRADRPPPAAAGLHRPGQVGHDVQVALDHRADARPLHLHHHLVAGAQPGGVHLRHRRGRQRPAVEAGEHLLGRAAQLVGEDLLHLRPRRRGAAWSRSRPSSSTSSTGSRSGRVDSTWPSFTKVTPPSSSACRTELASRARPPGASSSARRRPRR
jgi:hypothetical protein